MKVLITGIDGYIGVVLAQVLAERGHDVTGLDTGFYRSGWMFNGVNHLPETLSKDIREVDVKDLKGFDAVVHLAELSNDPLGNNDPDVTRSINYRGSVELAKKAKKAGISRFVYSSSCSVYGVANGEEIKNEESPVNSQTAYAKCKVLVEKEVAKMADSQFIPVFMRNATVYGPSPRMRFDLVLNNLAGLAWSEGEIRLESDGTPWRPLIHIRDACVAFALALEAPKKIVHNQTFNVGDTRENYQVKDIAKIVSKEFPGCKVLLGKKGMDNRSYRVSFDKIKKTLGFRCKYKVVDGATQLYKLFKKVDLDETLFNAKPFTRLKQIEYLKDTKQVNKELFWRES